MSVLLQTSDGLVVCHEKYLESCYEAVHKEDHLIKLVPHKHLFLVKTPYMKDEEAHKKVKEVQNPSSLQTRKRKFAASDKLTDLKVCDVKDVYQRLLTDAQHHGHFSFTPSATDIIHNNKDARLMSENLYKQSSDWIPSPFTGENNTSDTLVKKIGPESFVFPPNCKFFCRDVRDIKNHLDALGKFDLILLDPPWWNKYIRRKKSKCLQEGYKMMYNDCLGELPLNELLSPGGIIAVWCTNSKSNLEELRDKLFPMWGTKQIARWTWMKVTQSGHPVCPFSEPPGKQPFEQLIFGVRPEEIDLYCRPQDGKILMSVPSAIHSHKPPISDIMKPYVPAQPRSLEIFARYLLPNWTSWGLEVIKLQHSSLFHEGPVSLSEDVSVS
ncbi:hypothetical protein ONE63_010488 [Megalurothrips usitatus]|uniref:Methyltransferase-like protein 4 n=1 Tax=Megalurothrips usitatus TaxID=439358 RepID=A0AAV7XGU2_9NEOP|nr:hypothetical protein ONE63_010488 [Megalurothrips usitatus]